ncbi:hypothetical protein EVAR_63199_1 [Eumeta japonica]|uniref:Uncharacterized protein n=1 Tax=Eumeta variegata TaxID=151549 RepID=A0A4C1ZKM4_EUMVA|nr:hypothetical protein EVAR_63199_1 [Eumeta japonica]
MAEESEDNAGPDLPYNFLGFSPGPRGFKRPPAQGPRLSQVLHQGTSSQVSRCDCRYPAQSYKKESCDPPSPSPPSSYIHPIAY